MWAWETDKTITWEGLADTVTWRSNVSFYTTVLGGQKVFRERLSYYVFQKVREGISSQCRQTSRGSGYSLRAVLVGQGALDTRSTATYNEKGVWPSFPELEFRDSLEVYGTFTFQSEGILRERLNVMIFQFESLAQQSWDYASTGSAYFEQLSFNPRAESYLYTECVYRESPGLGQASFAQGNYRAALNLRCEFRAQSDLSLSEPIRGWQRPEVSVGTAWVEESSGLSSRWTPDIPIYNQWTNKEST